MPAHRLEPASADEAAAALAGAANDSKTIEILGAGSKRTLGGPAVETDVAVTTARLDKLLAYEPADLTISVQAGMRWAELCRVLDENDQMIPLDPPFADSATVGGALGADSSGPRRRRYGTARDMVIGMQFATAEGKLVSSGGMVVKNVTGLDMAKLMLGSFGTLAAITTVNFKVFPRPEREATFVFRHELAETLIELRAAILKGVAQPFALDLINQAGAQGVGLEAEAPFALLAQAEGSGAVVERYRSEYRRLAQAAGVELVEPDAEGAKAVWAAVREFHSIALAAQPDGALLRISTTAAKLAEVVRLAVGDSWLLSRAANAVVYLACAGVEEAVRLTELLRGAGFDVLVESLPPGRHGEVEQWLSPSSALDAMLRLEAAFDPGSRLNPGRLWGRI